MSSKVCVLPSLNYTLADYLANPRERGIHAHLSRSQLRPFLDANRVVVCQGSLGESRRQEAKRKEKTVVWIIPEEGSATRSPWIGHLNHGLSFRYGEELAKRIRLRESWAPHDVGGDSARAICAI